MNGLSFRLQKPVEPGSPNRMDVACFIGLVGVRKDVRHEEIDQWLFEQSWLNSTDGYAATWHRDDAQNLLNVPVPIDSWETFSQLFEWEKRPWRNKLVGAAYLATAVRSFFAQGGRQCYVIRVADPLSLDASTIERTQLISRLIPGFPAQVSSNPSDRGSWNGVGHLFGLPDVTLLCLPDLPDLVRSTPVDIDIEVEMPPSPPEQFVKCSDPVAPPLADNLIDDFPAPTSDINGYQVWGNAIHQIGVFIARYRRDIQLVSAIPLPDNGSFGSNDLFAFLHEQNWLAANLDSNSSIASSFVQLVYPWVKTAGSSLLPQGIEPPDGAFSGLLARNAISRGAYRSINAIQQRDIQGIYPVLSQQNRYAKYPKAALNASPQSRLIDRVSLFGFTQDGISVLSDVTTSNSIAHRPANVNRIISMVLRVARQAGEEFVFENNGEELWAQITQRMNNVLRLLYDLGALRGKEPEDAFFVRCDRSTMSQQDLDSGRVIAKVHFEPAASIESIDVVLAMRQSGQVSLSEVGLVA